MKLTYPQNEAIRKLKGAPWQTAWKLHLQASTFIALEKRGIVKRRRVAHTLYDSTDYEWALVEPAAGV